MQRIRVILAVALFCALAGPAAADATDTTYAGIDTPIGTNVVIAFGPDIVVTFDEVTQAGLTSLQISSDVPPLINFIPVPVSGPVMYSFQTTAVFDGAVICLGYSDDGLTPSEEEFLYIVRFTPQLDHRFGKPLQVDAASNIGCYQITGDLFDYPVVVALPGGICGDGNANGVVDVGDIVYLISSTFKHGPPPNPNCIGDINVDGWCNIGDALFLINFIFKDGPAPAEDCCDAPIVMGSGVEM